MKKLFTLSLLFLLFASFAIAEMSTSPVTEDVIMPRMSLVQVNSLDSVEHCYAADESYAVYHNGLWWAWLAPVATEWYGLTPDASLIGDGWRNVADADEWVLRPDVSAFGQTKCAAKYFFYTAPWCDWYDPYYSDDTHPNGYLTYYIDGSVADFWVVHDDCSCDNDNDGIIDCEDKCLGTVNDPWTTKTLGINRYMWDDVWLMKNSKNKLVDADIDMTYTYGCSCTQVLDNLKDKTGLDFTGHYKFGCSKSILDDWNNGLYLMPDNSTINLW